MSAWISFALYLLASVYSFLSRTYPDGPVAITIPLSWAGPSGGGGRSGAYHQPLLGSSGAADPTFGGSAYAPPPSSAKAPTAPTAAGEGSYQSSGGYQSVGAGGL